MLVPKVSMFFCSFVCWHIYLVSTQRIKWILRHWPILTFCDNQAKSLLNFYKNKQIIKLQGAIRFWIALLHSFKKRFRDCKRSSIGQTGWRELWSIHKRLSENKTKKKKGKENLTETT